MFGGASGGYCATGIVGIAISPARMMTSEQTDARMGRRMNVSTNINGLRTRGPAYSRRTGAPSASFWTPDTMTRSPGLSPPWTT